MSGTCSTCHDTPNVGKHSLPIAMNIGVGDADQRTPGLPRYALTNLQTGQTATSADPGVPVLRGVVTRPPYFLDGLAVNLGEVVQFYRRRFRMRLSDQDESDLVAFLSAL